MHIDDLDDLSGRLIYFALAAIFILFLSLLLRGNLCCSVPVSADNRLKGLVSILSLERIDELLLGLFFLSE